MTIRNSPESCYDDFLSELKKISVHGDVIGEEEIRNDFIVECYGKGEFLVKEGEVPGKLGFLAEGLVKYSYVDKKGNEWIRGFSRESEFVASYASFLYQVPSPYSIEALEPCLLLTIKRSLYIRKVEKSMTWCSLARRYVEQIYYGKEKREASLLTEDCEDRYLRFLEESGQLLNRVKVKDIASYLGMTPVSLSRIRKKMARKSNIC